MERLRSDDAWVPPGAYIPLRHMKLDLLQRRSGTFREFFGRLRPGATPEQAQQELRAAVDRLMHDYPDDMNVYERNRPTVFAHLRLPPAEHATVGKTQYVPVINAA